MGQVIALDEQERGLDLSLPWWLGQVLNDKTNDRRFWITKGLGAGGTYGLAIWHYLMCLINNRSRFSWSIAPTFQQVADTLLPTFAEVLSTQFGLVEGKDFEITASMRPRITFKNATRQEIHFKSANHPGRLVGTSVSHISGTEVGLWKREAYEKSSSRLRCPKAEYTQYLGEGTPEGFNWWEKEANFTEGEDVARNARRIILHTADNTHLKSTYVDNLTRTYEHDPGKLESYLYGRFVPFTKGTAYWEFAQSRCVVLDVAASPQLPLILSFDFNKSPAWVAVQHQPYEKNGRRFKRFTVLAEGDGKARGLLDACAQIKEKFPRETWGRVPVEVYGDPSGYFDSHKSPSCDFDVVYQNLRSNFGNLTILADHEPPRIRNRLERHNALFAYGQLVISAWCQNVIRSHTQSALKDGAWKIVKPADDDWTHFADALGYYLFQVTKHEDLENPDRKKILGLNKHI